MKITYFLVLSILIISSIPGSFAQTNHFVDDFENYDLASDTGGVWEKVYHYEDTYSVGGKKIVEDESQVLEVSRAYIWHNSLKNIFLSKMKVLGEEGSDSYSWYGSRIALVNPDNPLERYELRLYPNLNRIQANYVDRTGRTGNMEKDLELTTSEILDSAECSIGLEEWHYVLIMRAGKDKWKAMVLKWNKPTCILRWEDDRIDSDRPAIGVQSVGKYITSRFDEIFAV